MSVKFRILIFSILFVCFSGALQCQLWKADNGDGTYKNPVLFADYSDPDVIRVGDDFYMVASSFTCMPGIPVLHSKDMINWKIINHVYSALPLQRYLKPQHGQGSWAPSIRFHKGKYYVYFCTPQDGLFMASANNPAEKWELTHVQDVSHWEDPCPFWDEDGKAYLLRGRVGAGPVILHRMSEDGKKLLDNGVLIYEDWEKQPTLEGFKFMEKKDGYYYFSAPAGGVSTGWQAVFRSKNIYGPYEEKNVLEMGTTGINGPHQGSFVETQTGEWWFFHFQSRGIYGRVVHLQPVVWENGWPVVGADFDGNGVGEPVMNYKKPNVGKIYPVTIPQTSDNFDSNKLGLQWQWNAAPQKKWYSLSARKGYIRLYAASSPTLQGNLISAGNLLLQKLSSPTFSATAKIELNADLQGDRAGLAIFGNYYTTLFIEKRNDGNYLVLHEGRQEKRNYLPVELKSLKISQNSALVRVKIHEDATCSYSYSMDGKNFIPLGEKFRIEPGTWVGAKVGVFCISPNINSSKGYADVDFVTIE